MKLRYAEVAWIFLMSLSVTASAQSNSEPRFDVASIKPSAPGARFPSFRSVSGSVTMHAITLMEVLENAYGVPSYQFNGAPDWTNSDRFDIAAKSEAPLTISEVQQRLRTLLEDRFRLRLHRETKQVPVFRLSLVKKNDALEKAVMSAEQSSCTPPDPTQPPQRIEPGKPLPSPCGGVGIFPGHLRGKSATTKDLAVSLSHILGRPVIDNIGLTKKFDVAVEWTAEEGVSLRPDAAGDSHATNSTGLSIFTALQEQLGLKLESAKGEDEVLIIDSVEKPTAN